MPIPVVSRRRRARRVEQAAVAALRKQLVADGASLQPRRPERMWQEWVNTALRSGGQADEAIAEIRACGLLPHQDGPKNWDLLVALGSILERCTRSSPVLEMGAARYSPLLTWLFQYGFWHLRGIDLIYEKPARRGNIRFQGMDLTRTDFPSASFEAIATLSVVEHGVDLEAYLREAARLLRPGGVLITSTDFWCEPIDTAGHEAYGHEVRVFDRPGIEAFVALADGFGLRPVRPVVLECEERVVHWDRVGLDYTFVTIVLETPPGSLARRLSRRVRRMVGR